MSAVLSDSDLDELADRVLLRLRLRPKTLERLRRESALRSFMQSRVAQIACAMRDAIEAEAGLPSGAIIGSHQDRATIQARHAAVLAIHEELTGLSMPQIGAIIGGRDHTTILHSLRRARKLRTAGEIGWLLTTARKAKAKMEAA